MGRKVVRDGGTETLALGEEAFAGISGTAERVVLFLETREEFVKLVIMGAMYVMCELWVRSSERFAMKHRMTRTHLVKHSTHDLLFFVEGI